MSKNCLKCNKRANYNFEGEKPEYCATHKKEGMVDLNNKKCLECNKRPNYNFAGKKPEYCVTHKKEGMVDVRSKKCLECDKQPNYNFAGKTPEYCVIHKKDGMVDVRHEKCLECDKQAIYNFEGQKPEFCAKHKKDKMINVISKRCLTPMCDTIVSNPKYKGYCLRCFMYTYPEEPITRNYKTKERYVSDAVKENFKDFNINFDKIVPNGCSKKRPDIYIDLGYQIIIIEIDENQHKMYDCICENKRLMLLSEDFGHRPIVYIRFNPDDYINIKSEKITSCWGIDKRGICVIKKKKTNEWYNRIENLINIIKYWIINYTNKTIEIVHLFYDGYH